VKSFSKILVPIDFEPASARAVSVAMDLAQQSDAEVLLAHVYQPEIHPLVASGITYDAEHLPRMAAHVRARLEAVRRDPRWSRPVHIHILQGTPASALIELAQREGADLIVMGTRLRGGIERLLSSGVSERVARKAPCAVLTVKDPPAPAAPSPARRWNLARWFSHPFDTQAPTQPAQVAFAQEPQHVATREHLPIQH
jgi:nucleotide-binding universal stress UspA family protein